MSFTGTYRIDHPDSTWHSYSVGSSGSDTFEMPHGGSYVFRAEKEDYSVSPSEAALTLNEGSPTGSVNFTFTDTSSTTTYYTLNITGNVDGSPTSFTAEYRHSAIGSWSSVSIGSSGSTSLTFETGGTYFVRAFKVGHTVDPEIDTVYLGTGSEEVTASFDFTEIVAAEYHLTIEGNVGGSPVPFTGRYRQDVPGAVWTTVSIGASGSATVTLEYEGTYLIEAEKTGYTASPEMDTLFIGTGAEDVVSTFTFTEETTPDYRLTFMGAMAEGGTPTSFTGKYRRSSASTWTSVSVGASGIATVDLPEDGEYIVKAEKDGYVVSPETTTKNITDSSPTATASFTFSEEGTEEYYIHFIGEIDGERTSFTGRWRREATGAEWHEIAVGGSGTASATVTEPGRYVVHAIKDGYYTSEQVIELTEASPYEYVTFEFSEELDEYYIHYIGEIDGERTSFTGRYKRDLEGEPWNEITVGGSGTATATVYAAGRYLVQAVKDGYYAEEQTIELSADTPYEYVTFAFVDTTGLEFYIHLIGEMAGTADRTSFTSYWRSESGSDPWTSVSVGGSGTESIRVPTPGTYLVRAEKESHTVTPDTAEVTLTTEDTYEYVTFEFRDTTGLATHGVEIYVGDSYNQRFVKFDDMTCEGWLSYGSSGSGIGRFSYAFGFCYDESIDKFYLTDEAGRLIRLDNLYGAGWEELDGFYSPAHVEIGPDGKIYIVDTMNHRIVRVNNIEGDGWTTFGEEGDGPGQFYRPYDIDFDSYGRIYIADYRNSRLVRMDNMSGAGWTTFGREGSGVGRFDLLLCAHIGQDNKIYLADLGGARVCRIDDMSGAGWTEMALGFNHPTDIVTDSDGRIYITDNLNHRIVRVNDMSGSGMVTFGESGNGSCEFNRPMKIFIRETE